MRSPKVLYRLLGALLLVCVFQFAWMLVDSPSTPVLSSIAARYPIGSEGMVYAVVSDTGGATASFAYRYYLAPAMSDDQAVLDTLRKQGKAFLVTRDANTQVLVSGGHDVKVSVHDSVYSFNSTALLRTANSYVPVSIALDAQTGSGSVPSS